MNQPIDYSVVRRDCGHWDIWSKESGARLFVIRGEQGNVGVQDERQRPYPVTNFRTVGAAMAFIADELMYEPLP